MVDDPQDEFNSVSDMNISITMSLAISNVILIIVLIVSAKHDRDRILNKLTLIPLYFCIVLLCAFIGQLCLELLDYTIPIDIRSINMVLCTTKALFISLSAVNQHLEWHCLITLMKF